MRNVFMCCFVLAGCTLNPGKAVELATPPDEGCGAEHYSDLIGEPVANHSFDTQNGNVRIIPPNSAVTMDHRPDRLNVDVNVNGDIARLWCG